MVESNVSKEEFMELKQKTETLIGSFNDLLDRLDELNLKIKVDWSDIRMEESYQEEDYNDSVDEDLII